MCSTARWRKALYVAGRTENLLQALNLLDMLCNNNYVCDATWPIPDLIFKHNRYYTLVARTAALCGGQPI